MMFLHGNIYTKWVINQTINPRMLIHVTFLKVTWQHSSQIRHLFRELLYFALHFVPVPATNSDSHSCRLRDSFTIRNSELSMFNTEYLLSTEAIIPPPICLAHSTYCGG